jgi:hypothetical protein
LPDFYDGVVLFGEANGVHFNVASVAVVMKLKDQPGSQGITSSLYLHFGNLQLRAREADNLNDSSNPI